MAKLRLKQRQISQQTYDFPGYAKVATYFMPVVWGPSPTRWVGSLLSHVTCYYVIGSERGEVTLPWHTPAHASVGNLKG